MSTSSTEAALSAAHPAVPALALGGVAAITMFALHPVFATISLTGALACSLVTRGVAPTVAGVRWQLPAVALVTLANPLFTASGSTVVLKVGPLSVYAESLAFGATAGAAMVASLVWLECLARVVPDSAVRSTLGRRMPTSALVVSMTFALVPQLLRRQVATAEAAAANTASRAPGPHGPVAEAVASSGTLLGWALDDSLVRADVMRARGWGSAWGRTSYRVYDLRARDVCMLVALALALAVASLLAWVACSQWHFYPTMPHLVAWWGYGPFAMLCVIPAARTAWHRLSWHLVDRRCAYAW